VFPAPYFIATMQLGAIPGVRMKDATRSAAWSLPITLNDESIGGTVYAMTNGGCV